jgi:hypothetical protein
MPNEPIISVSIILAAIGGFTINVLNLIELQNVPKEHRPDFKDIFYWLPFLAWPFLGSVVAFVYNDVSSPLGKLVSFHIGLSTPIILRTMAHVLPAKVSQKLPPGA